jgi:hypothetical protein
MGRTFEPDAGAAITARDLTMTYRALVREAGLAAAARSLFRRRYWY